MIALIKNIQTTYLWRDNLLLTAVKLQMCNGKTRMSGKFNLPFTWIRNSCDSSNKKNLSKISNLREILVVTGQ